MQLRPATADDFSAIVHLLREAALDASDLNPAQTSAFLVLCEAGQLVACGAIESFDDRCGLVRSIAVSPAHRGQGHATRLMRSLETRARHRGIDRLFLLTQTATAFFARHQYERCDRALAPAAVQASPQFAGLCPATAVCMSKDLRTGR